MSEIVFALIVTIGLYVSYSIGYRKGVKQGMELEFLRVMCQISPARVMAYVIKQEKNEWDSLFKAFTKVTEWIGEENTSKRKRDTSSSV